MDLASSLVSRRRFLNKFAVSAAMLPYFTTLGAFAEALTRTPEQTEGPFYPDKLPLDTDNDLLIVNDKITPAVGEVTHLTGRILGPNGDPIRNALVEIWQCDNTGTYLHTGDSGHKKRDANFQGFGRFMTGPTGDYYFRTIKPVPYPGRTPHIHYKIKLAGKEALTTQCYIKGHPQNERDGIFRDLGDAKSKESVSVDFAPMKGSKIGELTAKWDVVLGVTPRQA